jgi:hypothetical protein
LLASDGAVDDLPARVFVHCGQRGDLALLVERGANDLLQYVVADLLGTSRWCRGRDDRSPQ